MLARPRPEAYWRIHRGGRGGGGEERVIGRSLSSNPRNALTANRVDFCRLLWRLWSPTWQFAESTYLQTAASFENPDFVDVVIHSYRHRYGYAPGDPTLEPIEAQLAAQPAISVPTINLHGADNGVAPLPSTDWAAAHFTGGYERRVLPDVGHNVPQERPTAVVEAVLDLLGRG